MKWRASATSLRIWEASQLHLATKEQNPIVETIDKTIGNAAGNHPMQQIPQGTAGTSQTTAKANNPFSGIVILLCPLASILAITDVALSSISIGLAKSIPLAHIISSTGFSPLSSRLRFIVS